MNDDNSFIAIKTPSVRQAVLRKVLSQHGCSWESACHVTPAGKLRKCIERSGAAAVPIGVLLDLIVFPGINGPLGVKVSPPRTTPFVPFDSHLDVFRARVRGKRLATSMELTAQLLKTIRNQDSDIAQSLWHGRHDFLASVYSMIASGFGPDDIDAEAGPMVDTARTAWKDLETAVPAIAAVRTDMWLDSKVFREQKSEHALSLFARIQDALNAAFGVRNGVRTIVYHGFYFYSPVQWALFQLLRGVPGIRQIFIVHDDGTCPAFESWRHVYESNREMPRPIPVSVHHTCTPMAEALRAGLLAHQIDGAALKGRLDIGWFADLPTFTSYIQQKIEEKRPLYSADQENLSRHLDRLRPFTNAIEVDLGSLPVGMYILRMHDCIRSDGTGPHRIVLSPEIVTDIAASGCFIIDSDFGNAEAHVSALRRALPFFGGCEAAQDWVKRADHLVGLIATDVARLGARTEGVSDAQRIQTAVKNPYLRVPWCDLTVKEAKIICRFFHCLTNELETLFDREQIQLESHFDDIRNKLASALKSLPFEESARIQETLDGASHGLAKCAPVQAVIDVVHMLLGRAAALQEFGGDPGVSEERSSVLRLRDLDALGFEAEPNGLHLANLADGAFPTPVGEVAWPFSRGSIIGGPKMSRDHLDLRRRTAMLGDLYLLWLALDGCADQASIKLSWIKDIDREPKNQSALLTLLTEIEMSDDWSAAREAIGGVQVAEFPSAVQDVPAKDLRLIGCIAQAEQLATEFVQRSASPALDHRAAASALLCPRRMAIQWVLGPSSAYAQEWLQLMAHGNVYGALSRFDHYYSSNDVSLRACKDLWRQFAPAALASTRMYSVIKFAGEQGASKWWLLTMNSSEAAGFRQAYDRAKIDTKSIRIAEVAPSSSSHQCIPSGQADVPLPASGQTKDQRVEICKYCPVNERCIDRVRDEWY